MHKIVYQEQYVHDPELSMRITWNTYHEADFTTTVEGEHEYCGSHAVHEFHVESFSQKPLKVFKYRERSIRNKGQNFSKHLEIARAWLFRFRHLMQDKAYHPHCHNLRGAQDYPALMCPEVSIRQEYPLCKISPFSYGYGANNMGIRRLPMNNECDLQRIASLLNEVVERENGFTLNDYWRCATKREMSLIRKEEQHES